MSNPVSSGELGTQLARSIAYAHEVNLRRQGLGPLIRLVQGLDTDTSNMPRPADPDLATSMLSSACIVGSAKLWEKTRVVYDVDPDLTASLLDMEMDAEFPGEVLRHLPHPNPMFIFRKPIESVNELGQRAQVRGFLVAARPAPNRVTSTAEVDQFEDCVYLVTAIVDNYDEDGAKEPYPTHVELFAPTARGITSVRKMLSGDTAIVREATVGEPASRADEDLTDFVRRLSVLMISHLLYVCCDKPDIESGSVPAPRKAKKSGARPERPARVHRVGWREGPAIRDFHQKVARLRSTGATGRTVIPHVRRGHPHTFRWGKGRVFTKVKWIPPLLVNADAFGKDADGIVVPVL